MQCLMMSVNSDFNPLDLLTLCPLPSTLHSMLDVQCSMLDVRQYSMFNLPAMPLDNPGGISSCLSPVTIFIPPSFVMQWQAGVQGSSVFTVHLSPFPHSMLDVQCSMLDVRQYSMFNLPTMPLDNLRGISSCFSPVTIFKPPSFVMQWQAGVQGSSVFTVHHYSPFISSPIRRWTFNVRCSTFIFSTSLLPTAPL